MLAGITANNDRAQGRVEGFVEALAAKGIDPAKIVIREGRYQIGDGRAAMASLLDQDPQITALFCGSDVLAFGAMFECRRRAISIPADLSIIGFDNLEISAYTDPPLTTLNVPSYEIGRKAAQYILRNEQGSAAIEYVTIPAELVERSTTMARMPNEVQDDA
jgi:LacI family transcriptional regulator